MGRCLLTGGSGGTSNCNQDGVPCTSFTTCCTNVCVDLGGGVPVCAVASGCRVTGDTCLATQQCCGGGTNPNGPVNCEGAPSGRCDNGQSCNGVGNICGKAYGPLPGGGDGLVYQVNTNNNCCDGRDSCHLDSSGIPRCFGGCSNANCSGPGDCPYGYNGEPGCCIDAGQQCQFGDQCCNGLPCSPQNPADPNSIYVCQTPSCVPLGSSCAATALPCCQGTCTLVEGMGPICQNPAPGCTDNGGSCTSASQCCSNFCPSGTCQNATQCLPDGTSCTSGTQCCSTYCDGTNHCATSPTCKDNGQSCTSGTECCSTNCVSGTCQPQCKTDGAACTAGSECCSTYCISGLCSLPPACQPLDGPCTATADCCSGYSCVIPSGQTSGTCQTGGGCGLLGQTCSVGGTPCCSGLVCTNSGTYTFCDGTTTCSCIFPSG